MRDRGYWDGTWVRLMPEEQTLGSGHPDSPNKKLPPLPGVAPQPAIPGDAQPVDRASAMSETAAKYQVSPVRFQHSGSCARLANCWSRHVLVGAAMCGRQWAERADLFACRTMGGSRQPWR